MALKKPAALRARGFTLVEMLVAVAILAIAMSAILSGMARYADNAAYLRQRTVALWVAHNRLTELQLQQTWPDLGKSDGTVSMGGSQWLWQAEVLNTQDERLRRVNIRVMAPGQKNPKAGAAASLSAFLPYAR
ncbi:type II secretion system minor pseudopilin GspI [Sinimarinibacterium sp. NLF-5-8]|uniref:type II secretion system minor pseudopilin GspI n=1 Tax=Sinimarinibacterium sp. NLF-5-8 TaxID=2698684 RepID=UPI00137BD386|nr:type II secretion system minor pseudopilin GspI [Sinimarinibacterium sp. NLF-5-8]QHS09483.1 type II secretion system minor pseudopilin GspI [Sinimarinibacterium sp. NLF-5-8]